MEITHVPYRGGGPAMNDVLGGHVDLIVGSAALVTAQLGTDKLRPILQMGRERLPVLKDTQTAIEAGYPGFRDAGLVGRIRAGIIDGTGLSSFLPAFTAITGIGPSSRITLSVTLPIAQRTIPERPWVDMAIRWALVSRAALTISLAALPVVTIVFTLMPLLLEPFGHFLQIILSFLCHLLHHPHPI